MIATPPRRRAWLRRLLLVGLIFAGMTALAAALFSPALPERARDFDPVAFSGSDLHATVERVNAALRAQWQEAGVQPAPPVASLTVARRLALGLTGRVPSLQEIRQFEAYTDEAKLGWWLAGIFADRRHADYIAERLGRTFVGTEDGPFLIYRRRRFVSWLSDELLRNRPYDDLVREIVSAEGLWTDQPATNFITVTVQEGQKGHPDAERLAGRVTRAFLGIRLDCAQCHNHPFESWKQADFQGLAAFFGQVKEGFTGTYDSDGELELENRKTGALETIAPRVPFAAELVPATGSRRQQLAHWLTEPGNPYFARAAVNRTWALLFGKPLIEPVDDLASADPVPAVLEILAADFRTHGHDLQRLIQIIACTEAFHLDSAAPHELTEMHDVTWAAFPLTRLRPEQVVGGVLQSASVSTIDAEAPLLLRLFAAIGEREFVKRYGDTGEDEFTSRGGTIPQRLLLMNGELVGDKTKDSPFNAATRIAWLAGDDRSAVETAYLAVLTRRPSAAEAAHFEQRLNGRRGAARTRFLEDLYWTLINTTEFAWNH
jgi:hypothetical protein